MEPSEGGEAWLQLGLRDDWFYLLNNAMICVKWGQWEKEALRLAVTMLPCA